MTPKANHVAQSVIDQFNSLPARRKPTVRGNGLHEWVPLSGIVLEMDGKLECVALATGMKCLPANKIPGANGIVLHDWHAEILALRTFNRFLLDECRSILDGVKSRILEQTLSPTLDAASQRPQPFKIRDGLRIFMYCSEAPCGDASMELTMAAQEDATPWDASTSTPDTAVGTLSGREFFSQLGIVRRKPARRDAPPTLSKSCSDKLSLKQCTSLLSSLNSLFISPENAYIDTLIVPSHQHTEKGFERAFAAKGRMSALESTTWTDHYSFKPFSVETTELEFDYSKRSVSAKTEKISASNVAAAWSRSGVEESIVGGVVQGSKTTDVRGASSMSRRRMWSSVRTLAHRLGESYDELQKTLCASEYGKVKESEFLAGRRRTIADVQTMVLKGWAKNHGDSSFNTS